MLAVYQELLDFLVIVEQVADKLGSALPQLLVLVRYALEQHLQVVVVEAFEYGELHHPVADDVTA